MQYTLRNIPPAVDQALRRRARDRGATLNEVAVEALRVGAGLGGSPIRRRDLSDLAGKWVEDPEFDAAIADQHRMDPDLWR